MFVNLFKQTESWPLALFAHKHWQSAISPATDYDTSDREHGTIYFGHPERLPLILQAVLTQIKTRDTVFAQSVGQKNPSRRLYIEFHAFVRLFVMLAATDF